MVNIMAKGESYKEFKKYIIYLFYTHWYRFRTKHNESYQRVWVLGVENI